MSDDLSTFVSGVASEPFLLGYDPKTRIWDKQKTGSPVELMYVLILSEVEARLGIEQGDLLTFDEYERLRHDDVSSTEVNLSSAVRYAKTRSIHHGGMPLVITLNYPDFQLPGINYEFRKPFGTISEIFPPIVRLDRIFKVNDLYWKLWGTCPEDGRVRAFRLEDITDNYS